MPITPNRPCLRCPTLTRETFCPACKVKEDAKKKERWRDQDKHRPNAYRRGYDSTWTKARKMYLRRNPLCERCKEIGKIVVASLVHHIKPLDGNQELRLDSENLMALCRDCHEVIEGRKK